MLSRDHVVIGGQLASPVIGLPPVLGNRAVCVRYQDPQYPEDFIFPARRLLRAVQPPRVLKPGNLSHEENRNWRPQIGMVRSHTKASLEEAGHRMLGHHLPRDRAYTSVPPVQQHHQHSRSHSYGPLRSGYVPHKQQGYNNQSQGYNQTHSYNRSGYGYQDGHSSGGNQGYTQGRYNSNQGHGYGGYQQSRYNQPGPGYSSNQQGRYNSNQQQPSAQSTPNRRYQSNQGGTWR